MDNQPTNETPGTTPTPDAKLAEPAMPTVTPTVVAPVQPPASQPEAAAPTEPSPVYPTATTGSATLTSAPDAVPAATKPNPLAALSTLSSQGGDRLPLVLAVVAHLVILLLIFVPSLVDSTAKVVMWAIVMFALSGVSLKMAAASQQKSEHVKVGSMITIVLASIALVVAVVLGAYNIKQHMVFNEIKNTIHDSADI